MLRSQGHIGAILKICSILDLKPINKWHLEPEGDQGSIVKLSETFRVRYAEQLEQHPKDYIK